MSEFTPNSDIGLFEQSGGAIASNWADIAKPEFSFVTDVPARKNLTDYLNMGVGDVSPQGSLGYSR